MRIIYSFLILLACTAASNAQNSKAQLGCKDVNLLVQADEQKQNLIAQGFELVNDGMLNMASREEFPVVVRLQAGVFYHFVFLGNSRAKKMNLKLFDPGNILQIEKQLEPLQKSNNIISFSFTPANSGSYTLLLHQIMKQELFKGPEHVCGSLSILKVKEQKQ